MFVWRAGCVEYSSSLLPADEGRTLARGPPCPEWQLAIAPSMPCARHDDQLHREASLLRRLQIRASIVFHRLAKGSRDPRPPEAIAHFSRDTASTSVSMGSGASKSAAQSTIRKFPNRAPGSAVPPPSTGSPASRAAAASRPLPSRKAQAPEASLAKDEGPSPCCSAPPSYGSPRPNRESLC